MDLGLDGRVALVTGASQGIGLAIAQRLWEEGCRVAVVARDKSRLDESARGMKGPHSQDILALACDVMSAEQVNDAVARTLERFGRILANTVSPAFTLTPLLRNFIQRHADEHKQTFAEAEAAMLAGFRPRIEVKRSGQPTETASVVAFLASRQASFVNGADVRVDGGSVASV